MGKRTSYRLVSYLICIVFLVGLFVFGLTVLYSNQSGSVLITQRDHYFSPRTTYHTITIDGVLSDWQSDENMGTDAGSTLRMTWNTTSFFISWDNTDWSASGDLMIYFNTRSGGSSVSRAWNGIHTLPFEADWAFLVENGYHNLLQWTVGSWAFDQPYSGSVQIGSSSNNITEISLPWADIATNTNVSVIVFAQQETNNSVWASFPTANPAKNSGSELFSWYYFFSIADGAHPNAGVTQSPLASFEANTTSGELPVAVQFTDTSTTNITIISWLWDFGDGTNSTLQNPTHIYSEAGNYDVNLTVWENDGDSDSEVKTSYIQVFIIYPPPIANFTATPTTGEMPLVVQFTDTSSTNFTITSWLWDFGDGTNSTIQSPIHIYSEAGNYQVALTVRDNHNNSDTLTCFLFIIVINTPETDIAGFEYLPLIIGLVYIVILRLKWNAKEIRIR